MLKLRLFSASPLNSCLLFAFAPFTSSTSAVPSPALKKKKSTYLFMVALSLPCCSWLSSCREWTLHRGTRLLTEVLLLLWSTDSRHTGLSSCSVQAQYLWLAGSVAPLQVESSQTRDQSRVSCFGGQILITIAPGESGPVFFSFIWFPPKCQGEFGDI